MLERILENPKAKMFFIVIIAVFAGVFLMSKLQASGKTQDHSVVVKEGYEEVTAIPGVSFQINRAFISQATAVTQISEDANFLRGDYYSYKDGKNKYILFNLQQLVVAAERGTSFHFSEDNSESALDKSNVMGIWFTKSGKKFNSEYAKGRSESIVNAGVVITNDLFADFSGKLVTLEDGEEEWSIFVGVPGTNYKNLSKEAKSGIDAIVNSFVLSNTKGDANGPTYALTISSGNVEQMSDNRIIVEETASSNKAVAASNENKIVKEEGKAYTSTIYSTLHVGDTGFANCVGDAGYENVILRIEKIYTDGKEFADQTTFQLPPGCHWEAAEYSVNYSKSETDPYLNIKLVGGDGEELKYRGIKYPLRTHDADTETFKDGDWITGNIVYYAIPNECKDYVLMCGDGNSSNKRYSAYYSIHN